MCLGAICWPRNRDDSKAEDTMTTNKANSKSVTGLIFLQTTDGMSAIIAHDYNHIRALHAASLSNMNDAKQVAQCGKSCTRRDLGKEAGLFAEYWNF